MDNGLLSYSTHASWFYMHSYCEKLYCRRTIIAFQDREIRIIAEMALALASGMKSNHFPAKATMTHLFFWFKGSLSPSLPCFYSV